MKNMLKKINLNKLTIILLLFSNIIYAQSILVTGKVVDKQGQPLPGVSILLIRIGAFLPISAGHWSMSTRKVSPS